jgi:RHS repeat-associated protein
VDACPFRWQTKWYDAESQHYYFGYRHYDPRFGRWLSRDPLGEAGGFNLYAYCGNDPVNRHDPLGLVCVVWDSDGNARVIEDSLTIICHGASARGMVGPPNMMRLNGKTWYSNPYDYPAGVAGGVVAAPQRLFSFAEEVINIVGGKYGTSGLFGLEWEVDFNLYDADSYEKKAARFVSPNAQFDSSSYKLGVFTGDLAANGVITLGSGEAFTFAKAGFGTLRLMSFGGEEIIGQGMVRGLSGFRGGPGARWVGELLPGRAGSFLELDSLRVTGDNLTPHHMPQAALKLTGYNEGGAIMMPQDLHVLTRTYGTGGRILARQEEDVAFRVVLFRDIRDVRSIVGSEYNSGLKDLLQYYRETFPGLMTKTPK